MSDDDSTRPPAHRRRPDFGEYASPEEQRASIKAPLDHHGGTSASDPPPAAPARTSGPGIPTWGGRDPSAPATETAPSRGRYGDRLITFALLGVGLYGMVNGLFVFGDFGEYLKSVFSTTAVTGFTPPSWARAAGIGCGVIYVVLWFAALLLSIRSLRRGRITFWIPLAAGCLAVLALVIVVTVVIGSDPSLIQQLMKRRG